MTLFGVFIGIAIAGIGSSILIILAAVSCMTTRKYFHYEEYLRAPALLSVVLALVFASLALLVKIVEVGR